MKTEKRICVWSGPRNISTALMYSFAQRADMRVFDEPLYAHYLRARPAACEYHPGADEILATMEQDGDAVVNNVMLADYGRPYLFFKQMTHHLVDIDFAFMKDFVNVILTRDPVDMLPSYQNVVERPAMHDVGYKMHIDLLDFLESIGQTPPILDSRETLKDPASVLAQLCEQIGIPFDPAMLQWEAGARPEDGSWATYWYKNVHRSTTFQKYKPKTEPFPDELRPLLEECLPYYERLSAMAIKA